MGEFRAEMLNVSGKLVDPHLEYSLKNASLHPTEQNVCDFKKCGQLYDYQSIDNQVKCARFHL